MTLQRRTAGATDPPMPTHTTSGGRSSNGGKTPDHMARCGRRTRPPRARAGSTARPAAPLMVPAGTSGTSRCPRRAPAPHPGRASWPFRGALRSRCRPDIPTTPRSGQAAVRISPRFARRLVADAEPGVAGYGPQQAAEQEVGISLPCSALGRGVAATIRPGRSRSDQLWLIHSRGVVALQRITQGPDAALGERLR